jgi:plastocyanin
MRRRPRSSRQRAPAVLPALLALFALFAHAALGATVTVNVTTPSGAAAEDTVIVFDPLDTVPPASHEAATIDQINKTFVPRVSVVRTGTAVTFPNSDNIRHQVYSFSPAKEFSLKLYAGSPKTPIVFNKPGLVILGCNIHDNMIAFVGIVDSPYFAKIPASGTASLNLPAGHYRLRVWNPNLSAAVPAQEFTVSDSPLIVPVKVALQPASDTVAPWP